MKLIDLFLLTIVMVVSLFLRLWRLEYPSAMYFDEVYHVPAAMVLARGDARTPFDPFAPSYDGSNYLDWLHPPLAKYLQAVSMQWFGFTPFAWRFPSAVFGTLSLIVFYFWLRLLGERYLFAQKNSQAHLLSRIFGLIAVFLLSLDGIFLTMSRIAMNDVTMLFFSLLAVYFFTVYLVKTNSFWLLPTGVCLGLALATKWSALWLLFLLLLYELGRLRLWQKLPLILFSFLFLPAMLYVLSYSGAFSQGLSLPLWFKYQRTIVQSQLQNSTQHLYSSDPLTWPLNWRSVWLWSGERKLQPSDMVANIYVLANPLLSIYVLTALLMTLKALLQQRFNRLATQGLYLLLLLYLSSFLPWILVQRIFFLHHYLLALPFGIALSSFWLTKFWQDQQDHKRGQALLFNLLFWPALLFVLFYPHWVGLPVASAFAERLYFALSSWR